jgi:hypothetical protein
MSEISATTSAGPRRAAIGWRQLLPVLAAAVLLIGAGVEGRHFRPPPDTSAYRARVIAAAADDQFPLNLGDWRGTAVPEDVAAVKLLHPIVMISRQYHGIANDDRGNVNDEYVGFLFVDCGDARDTVGHYPPICYPSQGWRLELSTQRDWKLPNRVIHGAEYTFVRGTFDGSGKLTVDNFFILPSEGTVADRTDVITAAGDLQRRFYGVAQVQLVFQGDPSAEEREQAFTELVGPMDHLIQTVENAGPQEGNGEVQ